MREKERVVSLPFVHLHVHSEYSLLDGLPRCAQIVERAKQLGQPAVALTDHGVMCGAVEFYEACNQVGVKPIIGMEAYLARRTRFDREAALDSESFHLLLLVENEIGYRNLMKLATAAQLEGFYRFPRVDKELLAQNHEGILCTSGCLSSEVPELLKVGRHDQARAALAWYRDAFAGRFYVELQQHEGVRELAAVNRELIALAAELELPLVATNDAHYLDQKDAYAQDVLICIQTGKKLTDAKRLKMSGDDYFLRSTEEMAALWSAVSKDTTCRCSQSQWGTRPSRSCENCARKVSREVMHRPMLLRASGWNMNSASFARWDSTRIF
jgi:DNA polymerase-3 subunit alpha